MLDLNDLASFVRVVDRGGFSSAAAALGVPKSTLSHRIARLEAQLGARLLHRTSRRFSVTDVGRDLHRHATAMLVEAEAAESIVRDRVAAPRGVVRMTCSVSMALELAPLLPRFLARYPRVELVQETTNRFVDLVSEGFDVGLRGHDAPLTASDLIQRPIARTPWQLFAAPPYLDGSGEPTTPSDLSSHACLMVPNRAGDTVWTLQHPEEPTVRFAASPRLASDDLQTLKEAAVAGLGVVALPAYFCRDAVAADRLRPVLPGWTTGNAQVTLLTPTRRGQLLAVRALIDFLTAEYPRVVATERADAGRRRKKPDR